jgi:hypothetical protein
MKQEFGVPKKFNSPALSESLNCRVFKIARALAIYSRPRLSESMPIEASKRYSLGDLKLQIIQARRES